MKNILKNMKEMMNEKKMGKMNKGIKSLKSLKSLKNLMQIFESVKTDNTDKTDRAIFATFATFAMQIFNKLVKCANCFLSIFDKGAYSEGSVEVAQAPTNHQVFSNLSPTMSPVRVAEKSRISPLRYAFAIVAMLTLGAGEIWGNDCNYTINDFINEKYGAKNGNTFGLIKYYDIDTYEFGNVDNTYGVSHISVSVAFPDLSKASAVKEKFQLQYKVGSGSWTDLGSQQSVGRSSVSMYNNDISISAGQKVYFKLVRVEKASFTDSQRFTVSASVRMAKTLSGSTDDMTFSDQTYGTTSSAQTRTFTFSNETTGQSITISNNTNSEEFPATISKSGDCTGSVTVSVQFRPSAQDTRSGSITVSGDCGSKTFTVKGNGLRANSALSMNNGSVNVSITGINSSTLDLSTLIASQTGNGGVTYEVIGATGAKATTSTATIAADKKTFSATETGVYTIRATKALTDQYNSSTDDFTVTVNKLQPTFVWQTFNHIYSGAVLTNLAQAQYNGANVGGLSYTYSSNNTTAAVVDVVDGTTVRVPTTGFTTNQDVRISVTTTETDYYLEGSSYHDYLIEPKKSPVFKLNGNVIADGATETIDLLIGEIATVSFENIDNTEATFTKPSSSSYVTYAHNSSTHTGVITATAFGTTNLTFSQAGNDTIFGHTGSVTVNVKKHPVELATPLNGITCEVEDSVTTEGVYSIVTSPVDGHPFADVNIVSSKEEVIRFVDDKWRAKNAGSATLSIRMPANAYWAGDTITATITVNKKTPAITWHLNDNYLWGARINDVVSSTNEDIEYSVTSNNPTVADYVNGTIEVYNKSGDVTFTLSQADNYKWNAASANLTKTIHVSQPDNHVEYVIGNVELKKDQSTVYAFTGVAKSVKFTPSSDAWADRTYNLYWSETGANDSYTLFGTRDQGQENVLYETEIPASAKYLKVEFDGANGMNKNTTGTFGGLTITARTGIEAPSSAAYGMRYVGNNPTSREINVDWYSVQPCTITLQGTNADRFQIKEGDNTISNAALDYFGTKTIEVSYKHDVEGSHTATLHIESADGKSANVILTGSTEKAVPQIIWSDDVSPINRNILIPDAATATSKLNVVLTAEDATVVQVTNGNEITGLKEGRTRVFAYQAGDTKWASIRDTIEVIVTDKKVQHIVWNDRLLNVKREEGKTKTETLHAYSDADNTLPITYSLDEAARAFASVSGNTLTVTGWGRGTITATQAGNAEYVGLSKTMKLIARNPDAGCDSLVLNDAAGATLHTIDSKTRVLNGEPRTIEFDASCTWSAVNGLYVGEFYDDKWHEVKYIARTGDNNITSDEKHFGPYELHRNTTSVKLYTEFGATMNRTFKNLQVTQAKYLELAENATDFSRMEIGQVEVQQIIVNYSNLTGTLDVELQNPSTQFTIMTQTLGEKCGETVQGALVSVRCVGKTEGTENNVVILSNKDMRLEVPISATVSKLSQAITWDVASTVNVNTTDEVVLAATATSGLAVSFSSSDNETAEAYQKGDGTWALRIHKAGTITLTASQSGNGIYGSTSTNRTYIISRVTPEIIVIPTAETVSIPATLAEVDLTDGKASVDGTFAWQTPATSVDRFNSGYTVLFTPENTNWYNTTTCNVVVPVNKDAQTITWNFSATEVSCDADITFDASASSQLAVSYESSNSSIAYVDEANKLNIVCGGEVTITVYQDGNETFAAATPVAKTLTINKITPDITAPAAAAIKKGKLLDNATLTGGVAMSNSNEVEGVFTWEDGSEEMNTPGIFTRKVIFTPSNTNYYNVVRMDVDVEVQKFSPTIAHTLTASAITYGETLSTSVLSGTLIATDEVKVPNVEVEGTYAWLNGETILNAGNPTTATVRFTPNEIDQYNIVDIEISIVVNQAEPVLNVKASGILSTEPLSRSVLTNEGTAGMCAWSEELNPSTATYAEGDYNLAYIFTPNDPNYLTKEGTVSLHVTQGCVITDNTGSGNAWNNESNWESATKPTESDHVFVKTNLEISGDVTVGALTIEEGKTIVVKDGGSLTITGEGDAMARENYGNIYVENGGKVEMGDNAMPVQDIVITASLGGGDESAASGEVVGQENLNINGNIYIEISFDPSGRISYGWYDFVVPFEVNMLNGISRVKSANDKTLVYGTDFALIEADEVGRANGKNGWKRKSSGVLQPGKLYSIGFDDEVDQNTFRFAWNGKGSVVNGSSYTAQCADGSVENLRGWNGMGNGMLQHGYIPAGYKVQAYNHSQNRYELVEGNKTFAVGTAFFVQVEEAGDINWTAAEATEDRKMYAPARVEARATEEFCISLRKDGRKKAEDILYFSASEDATNSYMIGHDLTKMGNATSAKVAQMWTEKNGLQLCDIETPLYNSTASTPLMLFAPQGGEFTLAVEQVAEGASLYLTYNGNIIWDLTAGSYDIELDEGTNYGYGLLLEANKAPQITTGVDESDAKTETVRKVMVENQLYIISPEGQIYNVTGKKMR